MSTVGVELNGDSSGFRAAMDKAAQDAGKFSGEIASKVAGKLTGMRDVSTAVATALGINFQSIASNMARLFTGVSKDAEDALKRIEQLSTQNADESLKNMRMRLTEEQKYQLALKERERAMKIINDETLGQVDAIEYVEDALLGQIAVMGKAIDENKRQLAIQEAQKRLHEAQAQIGAFELSQSKERAKIEEEAYKAAADGVEKEYQAKLSILSTEGKIAAIKKDIEAGQAVIALGLADEKDIQIVIETIQKRKNQLVAEEAKLIDDIGEDLRKNAEAEADAMDKRIDMARAELPLARQKEELLQNLKTVQDEINNGLDLEFDVTKEIKRETEIKGKLKDIEKKQNEANVEIAKLMLRGAENLTKEEKLRLEVLQGQTTQRKIDDEIGRFILAGVNNLTATERERLAVLTGQSAELQAQLAKLAEMNKAAKDFVQTISRSGQDYEDQTTISLEGARSRVKAQLDRVLRENAMTPGSRKNPMQYALESELAQIDRDLNARRNINKYNNQFGEDATRFKYGDTLTDKALRDIQSEATKQRVTMEQFFELFKNSIAATRR